VGKKSIKEKDSVGEKDDSISKDSQYDNVSWLGFRDTCEDEKNRKKILSLEFLLLLFQDKSKRKNK